MAGEVGLAWAAGLVDGEGCIAVVRQKRPDRPNDGYGLHLTVSMVYLPALERLQDFFGGKIYSKGLPKARCRQAWYWSLGSDDAVACLRKLRPYLIVKRHEADIALQFRKTYVRVRFPKGGRPAANEQRLSEVYHALRQAKRYEFTGSNRVSPSSRRD